MTAPFVLDSSAAVSWVLPGQAADWTRSLLEAARDGASLHVPALWHLEVSNTLLVAVRRKIITDANRRLALTLFNGLLTVVDHETSAFAFTAISDLAVKYSLSAYDAAYLELASRKSLPLATRDDSLKSAARESGVKLL